MNAQAAKKDSVKIAWMMAAFMVQPTIDTSIQDCLKLIWGIGGI
jgi:hypothetical protein